MAYIVDFTIIMQVIFALVANPRLRLSRPVIMLAVAAYKSSLERIQVRNEIQNYAKPDGDEALKTMLGLINNCQIKADDMDKLLLVMEGFDNVQDELWDVKPEILSGSVDHQRAHLSEI